jgi:hypothetical protein
LAFRPPSVIQAAPSGPTITPCGAEPEPIGIASSLPFLGSSRPRKPLRWPVYQIAPSTAGATSCGREFACTGKYDTRSSASAGVVSTAIAATTANKRSMHLSLTQSFR